MSVKRPGVDALQSVSDNYGFDLTSAELAEFETAISEAMTIYDRLDEFADERLPVKYPRADIGYRPTGDENPSNGWIWKCSVPGATQGPLAGRTVALKDNISLAGIPMLNGSPIMEGFVPQEDATVVTRLLDAGAHIIGKTAVPAFCLDGGGCTGYPEPQPVNPHDPERLAGSSSNGSGVVVTNEQADMALGGDQGGSIRLPASWSGCYGLKGTHGLVPYTGIFPIEKTVDHVGPMARTAEDCARMLEVLAGSDGLDPRQYDVHTAKYTQSLSDDLAGLRIGILAEGFGSPGVSEPDVDDAVREAIAVLEKAGAKAVDVSVPMHSDGLTLWNAIAFEGSTELMVRGDAYGTNSKGHYSTDLMDFYGRARRARGRDFSDTVKLTVLAGHYMSENYNRHYYGKAQNLGRRLAGKYDQALEKCDLLVMPTTAMKAVRRPADRRLQSVLAGALGNLHNTAAFDISGHPAMSVPVGLSEGLPVGMQLVGRRWDESTVLKAAHAYQVKAG